MECMCSHSSRRVHPAFPERTASASPENDCNYAARQTDPRGYEVGPTHASLVWSAADDDPNPSSWLYRDGVPILQNKQQTSANVALLSPETTYNFTVKARDDGVNDSPMSDPEPATTTTPDPNDVTPPTVPTNLWAGNWGDCEVELTWDDSTDDVDPQWVIRYDIYVNGRFDHSTAQLITRAIVYGDVHGLNNFSVIAVGMTRDAPPQTGIGTDSQGRLRPDPDSPVVHHPELATNRMFTQRHDQTIRNG